MLQRSLLVTLGGALAAALFLMAPTRASACGGCFAPPTGTPTVVEGHRMAVSISPTETTLWDQIEYSGDPEDFVWVLPIQGEQLVELADNTFFQALEQTTQVSLIPTFSSPQTSCPFSGCGPSAGFAGADAGAADAGGSVTVYGEAVVGPYETATIGSEDPSALVTWLQDHGYMVPDTVLPVIQHYTDLGMNFAVLRLNPNAGVDQMQPVRVTTPGLAPTFPLRMVAAGAFDSVKLVLYIIGEGRWGANNFEVDEIAPSAITFDWNTSTYDYDAQFEAVLSEHGHRAWIAEYAQPEGSWRYQVETFTVYDEDGTTRGAAEDLAIATRGLAAPYLTKLRTDLPVELLGEDLILEASTAGDVSNLIYVSNQRNRPADVTCPPPPRCDDTTWDPTSPGTRADARTAPSRMGGCSVSGEAGGAPVALGLIALGVVALMRRRRL